MKQRALALIHGLRPSFRNGKRWLILLLLAIVLAPPSARAAGIGDILTSLRPSPARSKARLEAL